MLRIWARDENLKRRGTLKALAGKVLLKRTAVGGFHLEVEPSTSAAQAFTKGWGLIVLEDDQFLFSGPVSKIRRQFTNGAHLLVLEGETDMRVLDDRDVYPDPARASGSQSTVTHFKREGVPAEDIILELIRTQASNVAGLSYRQDPHLVVPASLGRGLSGAVEARWTRLLREVQGLANVSGLVVDIGQTDPGVAEKRVLIREPADLSRVVRFTPTKGLGDYWVELEEPLHTVTAVGGSGQGLSRSIWGKTINPAWGNRRREVFLDRRDTADVDAYRQTSDEHGKEVAEKAAAGFTITETARYRLGRDFLLGDIVSVYAGDKEEDAEIITGPVTSADLEWDGYGRTVDLRVGENNPGNSDMPIALEKAWNLERRLSRMEGGQ